MYYRKTYGQKYRLGFPRWNKLILGLIIANASIFFFMRIAPGKIIILFGLVPHFITHKFYLWQFVTYMFLHGSLMHLFFNMFALFIFGSELLKLWGTKRFLQYYFFTGIGAGLCAYIFTNTPTIGASGAVFGLLLAYGIAFPNRMLLVFFVIPMKAKYFVIIFGAIELLSSITSYADGIAHIAHLGGMIFGAIFLCFIKWRQKHSGSHSQYSFGEFTIIPPHDKNHNIYSVDELLDKILKYGVDSLTTDERTKLMQAGKFFAKQIPPENKRKRDR